MTKSLKKGDATEKLFGGINETPIEKSQRLDRYRKAIADEPWGAFDAMGRTTAGNLTMSVNEKSDTGQQLLKVERTQTADAQMRSLLANDTINKAIGADVLSSIEQSLGTITKDI